MSKGWMENILDSIEPVRRFETGPYVAPSGLDRTTSRIATDGRRARRISSPSIWYQKRVIPVVVAGLPALFVVGVLREGFDPTVLLFAASLALFWCVLFRFIHRRYIAILCDEVLDRGDALVVRNGGHEDVIPLESIEEVISVRARPQRVTLRLDRPTKFGTEVSFSPPFFDETFPLYNDRLAEELASRARDARSGGVKRS